VTAVASTTATLSFISEPPCPQLGTTIAA